MSDTYWQKVTGIIKRGHKVASLWVVKLFYLFQDSGYENVDRSQLPELNDLNLDLLKQCILMAETDAGKAIRTFRQGM